MVAVRSFNVVFQWNEVEYKLLNVYNIHYYKCFAYLVEHALYEASICIANKHRLTRIYEELMSINDIDNDFDKETEQGNQHSKEEQRKAAFRKSMRELDLEVVEYTDETLYKHWKHIEIRISEELYYGEEVFWKTMDLVNRMQALRVYYLL